MRVLYVGNFRPAHSTENEIASCFRTLGWETACVQEDDLAGGVLSWAGITADCLAADLVLYTRTPPGLPADRAVALWEACAEAGVPTASVHLDLFYGLDSVKGELPRRDLPAHDPMFRTDHVFSTDGDHDELWLRDGVNHHWLPAAIGCDSTFDAEPDPQRWAGIDVAFVGSKGYHSEYPNRPRLIEELRRRFGDRFAHVSGETQADGHAVRGVDLHRLYATVPVIVGDSCWVDVQPPATRYWSDRVYEVWGRGGFLLMPEIAALLDHLGSYPSWKRWDDFDAMEGAVRFWLDNPKWRGAMRADVVRRVRSEHTWAQRIREMLDVMGIA